MRVRLLKHTRQAQAGSVGKVARELGLHDLVLADFADGRNGQQPELLFVKLGRDVEVVDEGGDSSEVRDEHRPP